MENFVDLAHFAFVHPNTLFDPNIPSVIPPAIDRVNGQMIFHFDPPSDDMPIPDIALMAKTDY